MYPGTIAFDRITTSRSDFAASTVRARVSPSMPAFEAA